MAGASSELARTALTKYMGGQSAALRQTIRFVRRNPLGGVGGLIVLVLVIAAISAPYVAPLDPDLIRLGDKYASPGELNSDGERYLLGSDQLGRDIFSRLMMGARISLRVGLISVAIGVTAGALIGIATAYLGGIIDLLFQRIVDGMMAFPGLILALGIMAVLGASERNVIIVLIILFIPGSARVVRSTALAVKETVYIDAARAIGCSDMRIIFRHLMPNCVAPYIVFRHCQPGRGNYRGGILELSGSGNSHRCSLLGRHAVLCRHQVRGGGALAPGLPQHSDIYRCVRV